MGHRLIVYNFVYLDYTDTYAHDSSSEIITRNIIIHNGYSELLLLLLFHYPIHMPLTCIEFTNL